MNKLLYILTISLLITACESSEKDIPPPEIFLQMPVEGFDYHADSTHHTIEPKITYDIQGQYTWSENGEPFYHEKVLKFNSNNTLQTYHYNFKVVTAYGEDAMDILVNALHINTFEESKKDLNDNGYINNPAAGYHEFKDYIRYSVDYDAAQSDQWSGFALSKNTDKSDATIKNEFSVYDVSGAEESEVFSVFKQSETIKHRISFNDNQSHTLKSIMVNNSTLTYKAFDSFDKKANVDYMLLTITGYNSAGAITQSVDTLLADFRPIKTPNKFIISEWTEVDLKPLGSVQSIELQITSSADSDPNKTLPKYVCIDNLKISS